MIETEEFHRLKAILCMRYDVDPTYFKRKDYLSREDIKRTLDLICSMSKDIKILDLCAGIGLLAYYLHQLGYHDYIGIERHWNKVAAGKELFDIHNIQGKMIQGLAERIDLPRDTYDVITFLDVSYFASIDLHNTIEEIIRLLKPGGYLLMDIAYRPHTRYHNIYSEYEVREALHNFSAIQISPLTNDRFWVVAQK